MCLCKKRKPDDGPTWLYLTDYIAKEIGFLQNWR